LGISIESGQGNGKDAWVSWFKIWFLIFFNNVLIPCTAPSADQLKNILWAEVSRWLSRNGTDGKPLVEEFVRQWIVVQSDRIFRKPDKGKDITNFSFPKTANPKDDAEAQAKTLYGYHDKHMAIILDDAAGVPDPVFKPLEGTVTRDVNFIIILFNPIFNTGFAIETHTGPQSHKWILLQWDSEESELVTLDHIKDMEEKYGRDSNTFRTLVKGLPPVADNDSVIPYEWVMAASKRKIEPDAYDPKIGGLDCGAGGDNSVLRIRHGYKVLDTKYRFSSPDSIAVGDWAAQIALEEELDALFVDVIGVGNGAYNELVRVLKGSHCKVYAVDVRNKARDEERYGNLRDELWWKLRELFEKGIIAIPPNQMLMEEIWAPRVDWEKKKGRKWEIESKYKTKKRLKFNRSPNDADSVILTLAKNDLLFRHRDNSEDDRYEARRLKKWQQQRTNNWMRA
jgi:hypothetical protein